MPEQRKLEKWMISAKAEKGANQIAGKPVRIGCHIVII